MKIYAIKNKISNLYLSEGKAMARTRAKLSNKPRLFTSKNAASNALACWCLGEWHNSIDSQGDPEGPTPPDKKPEDRNKEEFEIVEAEVSFNAP